MSFRNPCLQPAAPSKPEITFLISSNVPYTADRLRVSDGVQLATPETTAQDYAGDAYIPLHPSRQARLTGILQLEANETPLRTRTVGLLKISEGLLTALRRAAARFSDPSGLQSYIDDLCAEVPAPWQVREAPPRLTLGRNAPGLHTVTRDPVTGRYVGLHVDTFDHTYDAARNMAGNRISINIGAEPRCFLFVPLAYKSLSIPGTGPCESSIVTEFLRSHPRQKVLSLRVDPGEAYIAATESMVHDASSFEMRSEDVHITGRGFFEPGRL